MGHDDKPLLTPEGRPILQDDLKFSDANTLCCPGGKILRSRSGEPLLRDNVYIGRDGHVRLSRDGKVVEVRDVVRNFDNTPLCDVFNEPITRGDLKFSEEGVLTGLGRIIYKRDGT